MTGRDDYLWDRSGEPDAEVHALEAMLRPLAHDGRQLDLGALPEPDAQARPMARGPGRTGWLLAAAAALLIGAVAAVFAWREEGLHPGAAPRTFVTAEAPRTIALGPLVDLTLEPGSELRFEHWRADQALCRLVRGALIARVAPPPAVQADFFLVDTPLGRVTDKGCRYELRILPDGRNHVRVTEGMVTFARGDRTIWVPVGAQATVGSQGASTPLFELCNRKVRETAERYDGALWAGRVEGRIDAAQDLAFVARDRRDSLVLWHLLFDADERVRAIAESALVDLVGTPPGSWVTKDLHWDPAVWLAFLRIGPWMEAK